MGTKFGILAKINFLQDMASFIISKISGPVVHNIEKYAMLSKLFYYTACENISGDYLEFGVYTGSSLCHAIRCDAMNRRYAPPPPQSIEVKTRFYGFDSFDGFGNIDKIDEHPFYLAENFVADYKKVQKRIAKFKNAEVKLVKGFFNESLINGADFFGIKKARIIFIDSDTYGAAKDVLNFCRPVLQVGTVIVFDDWLSYRGQTETGEMKAFNEFVATTGIGYIEYGKYGACGGVAYIVNKIPWL
jgi:hypothetical protein